MAELTLIRRFRLPQEKVWDFVTRPENLAIWWGHDGWTTRDVNLDLTRTGPWHSYMLSEEGNSFDLAGEVLEVSAPDRVRFSWAWLDTEGKPGPVSEVSFSLAAEGEATLFTLHHTSLPDAEAAGTHEGGWTAVLRRLERYMPQSVPT